MSLDKQIYTGTSLERESICLFSSDLSFFFSIGTTLRGHISQSSLLKELLNGCVLCLLLFSHQSSKDFMIAWLYTVLKSHCTFSSDSITTLKNRIFPLGL